MGPSPIVQAKMNNKTVLTCEAEGNPAPRYSWLQMLPTQEVLIRGDSRELVIENITYDYQGEFVCQATNEINGEQRTVQSEPIKVEVTGAPQIMQYSALFSVKLAVFFCYLLYLESNFNYRYTF